MWEVAVRRVVARGLPPTGFSASGQVVASHLATAGILELLFFTYIITVAQQKIPALTGSQD
jgi:hypothetical protein